MNIIRFSGIFAREKYFFWPNMKFCKFIRLLYNIASSRWLHIILVVFALQEPAIYKCIQQEEMGIVDVNNSYTGEQEWQV
jgi:hypothetical protein